ncbi:MAG: hypothetical protein AB1635_18265 [Acidobacteriota bacterium]
MSDELYRLARVKAAETGTTVSALVRAHLEALVAGEPPDEVLRREQNDLIARIRRDHPGFSAAARLTRAAVHERRAVR